MSEIRFGGRCQKHPLNILPCEKCAKGLPPDNTPGTFTLPTRPSMTTNEHTEQSERALTDAQCDRAIESAGLRPLACATPQNLALLRGLCRAAALLAADKTLRSQSIPLSEDQRKALSVTGDVSIPGAADKAGGEVVKDAVLAELDALGDEAAVHIFPDDLERCGRSECVVEVTSVRAGSPTHGHTVPLFSRQQVETAIDAAMLKEGK